MPLEIGRNRGPDVPATPGPTDAGRDPEPCGAPEPLARSRPQRRETTDPLADFVDRVIVPALVERFLAEHAVRRPERHAPLVQPNDAA
jgi:hypothetical protein